MGRGIAQVMAAQGLTVYMTDLKQEYLDNALRERVVTLIRRHDLQLEPEPRLVKRWLGRLGPELFFQWTALAKADAGAKFPDRAPGAARWEQVEALARQILAERPCLTLRDLEAPQPPGRADGRAGPFGGEGALRAPPPAGGTKQDRGTARAVPRGIYPSITSSSIITRKPHMTLAVPTWECSPRWASGISSSTTT